ncbi:hypothetical protein E2542_SST25069 [Spatholobus suberectus]|nr:hypothetical protein E2542_SST25069 [Spatholobus suberectus]
MPPAPYSLIPTMSCHTVKGAKDVLNKPNKPSSSPRTLHRLRKQILFQLDCSSIAETSENIDEEGDAE